MQNINCYDFLRKIRFIFVILRYMACNQKGNKHLLLFYGFSTEGKWLRKAASFVYTFKAELFYAQFCDYMFVHTLKLIFVLIINRTSFDAEDQHTYNLWLLIRAYKILYLEARMGDWKVVINKRKGKPMCIQ